MGQKLLSGIYSAIFSVYDRDMNVKTDTVYNLVDYQLANGLKGFYVCGNTGECSVLPASTRMEMLECVVKANRGRGQIIAHIGAAHFDQTKSLLTHACGLKIDAVASLPPALGRYYGADETFEYYKWLSQNSRYPVYAYITPVLNCDPVQFARRLMRLDNVAGIKLTISDYYAFGTITCETGDRLNILNGPDETMICGLALGADGAIGTSYNYMPATATAIYDNFRKGNIDAARRHQRLLNRYIDINFGKSIAFWKAGMTALGFDMGYTVFPCIMPDEKTVCELKQKLEKTGLPGIAQG